MVGMIMCEKYAVDIVVGDSQIEELFKVSVTEINKRVDFFSRIRTPEELRCKEGTAVPEPSIVTFTC